MSTDNPSKHALRGANIEVPEARYKIDLELHDRYQSYSSEILKLSLGGMAVIGFLLTLLLKDAPAQTQGVMTSSFRWTVFGALIGFSASIALSLGHKFLASDGMYHHIRAIRLLILAEKGGPVKDVSLDEEERNAKFLLSGRCLYAAATALALGAISLAGAFQRMLFHVT